MLKSPRKIISLPRVHRGQAMLEYTVVTVMIAAVLIFPYDGKRTYEWVIYTLENLNLSFVNGLSLYAYPL